MPLKRAMTNPLVPALIIVICTFSVYANSLQAGFFFDDEESIVNNRSIQDLGGFLSDGYSSSPRRYVAMLTFALNYRLHGLDPFGYHFVNVMIHACNGLLLYWLFLFVAAAGPPRTAANAVSVTAAGALFAALLFAVHPVQTQAVAYVAQRYTSLAAAFYLAAVLLYVKWRTACMEMPGAGGQTGMKAWLFYGFSLLSAALAMKTKEMAFTLPAVIAVSELLFFRARRLQLRYLIPYALMLLIVPLSLVGTDKPVGAILSDVSDVTRVMTEMSRSTYLFTQFRVMVTYLRLLIFPFNQNFDYDYPVYSSLLDPAVFTALLLLVCLLLAAVYCAKKSFERSGDSAGPYRMTAFGIFWFFIAISVESSIIPIADVIFEHRLYLPSIGIFIAVGSAASLIMKKPGMGPRAIAVLMAAAVMLFSGATYARNMLWLDEIAFWTDNAEKSPGKGRPRHNLGVAYAKQGKFREAQLEYLEVLQLDPRDADVRFKLAGTYEAEGRLDDAIAEYRIFLYLKPGRAAGHYNLGNAYYRKGMIDEARAEYEQAVRLAPGDADAVNNLGETYKVKGSISEAREMFRRALVLEPSHPEARKNLEDLR